jgi:hypothetical protein
VGLSLFAFLIHYTYTYPQQAATAWQPGYLGIAERLYEQRGADRPVYLATADDRLFLWIITFSELDPVVVPRLMGDDYKISQIDNLKLDMPEPTDTLPEEYVIITDAAREEETIDDQESRGAELVESIMIRDEYGVMRYRSLWFQAEGGGS